MSLLQPSSSTDSSSSSSGLATTALPMDMYAARINAARNNLPGGQVFPVTGITGRVRAPREHDPAFDSPNVKAALARLRGQLKEASRKTGDIKSDMHKYITIPFFKLTLDQGNTALLTLKGNNHTPQGRPIPSKAYGWFQAFFDSYCTNYALSHAFLAIAPNSNPAVRSFRMKYSLQIRVWWVTNRDPVINTLTNTINRAGGLMPFIQGNRVLAAAFQTAAMVSSTGAAPSKAQSDALHNAINNLTNTNVPSSMPVLVPTITPQMRANLLQQVADAEAAETANNSLNSSTTLGN